MGACTAGPRLNIGGNHFAPGDTFNYFCTSSQSRAAIIPSSNSTDGSASAHHTPFATDYVPGEERSARGERLAIDCATRRAEGTRTWKSSRPAPAPRRTNSCQASANGSYAFRPRRHWRNALLSGRHQACYELPKRRAELYLEYRSVRRLAVGSAL